MKNLKLRKRKVRARVPGIRLMGIGRRTVEITHQIVASNNWVGAGLERFLVQKAERMQEAYWKNKLLHLQVFVTLSLTLALVFILRDMAFQKWPIAGFPAIPRLFFKGLPFAITSVLLVWIHGLLNRELEEQMATSDHLYAPDGITRDLHTLVLIARANAKGHRVSLVRAFNRGSEVWLKRYTCALYRHYAFLGFGLRTRIKHQAFQYRSAFDDLRFGMIRSDAGCRRKTEIDLSLFHQELREGFGVWTQVGDTRVTLIDFLRMEPLVRIAVIGVIAVLVWWKPEWRFPAAVYTCFLLIFFGHTRFLEKVQESVLDKVNLLK